MKLKYGLSEQDVRDMQDKNKGCCAICGVSLITPDQSTSYCIDHDHKTGEVRNLLCQECNKGLGNFRDDVEIMQSVINYIISRR